MEEGVGVGVGVEILFPVPCFLSPEMILDYLKLQNYRRFSATGRPASGARELRLGLLMGIAGVVNDGRGSGKGNPVPCPLFPVS
jgi:hypothetical protein